MESKMASLKILVVGDSGVGKTALVHHICTGQPLLESAWTVGCDICIKLHEAHFGGSPPTGNDDDLYSLELWDVGGSSRYAATRPVFWSDPPDGIILVHDLSNRKSYDNLASWHAEVLRQPDDSDSSFHRIDALDTEAVAGSSQPFCFVIGTKLDKSPAKSTSRCAFADSIDASCASINSMDAGALKPGTQARVALDEFFDRLISRNSTGRSPGTHASARRKLVGGF